VMVVASVACLVGLVVVLVALARDKPPAVPSRVRPALLAMPTPADVARADFPLAWPGYDPAAVDMHLEAVAKAWAELLAAAPPEVVDRAERLAALRASIPFRPDEQEKPRTYALQAPPSSLAGTDPDAPGEALRTHAALELLTAARIRAS
jgi:DivIVA domain-containing protein